VVLMASKEKQHEEGPESIAAPANLKALAEESQVDFELRFFGAILQHNPTYVDVLRVMGNNLTLKGRIRDGLDIDQRLVRLRPNDPLAYYNLACSYALLKRTEPAIKALRKAVELGYHDLKYMKEDRDLDHIRNDPRYKQILREFERKV
jgi:tetratricopeptide (TPR) repeat protein